MSCGREKKGAPCTKLSGDFGRFNHPESRRGLPDSAPGWRKEEVGKKKTKALLILCERPLNGANEWWLLIRETFHQKWCRRRHFELIIYPPCFSAPTHIVYISVYSFRQMKNRSVSTWRHDGELSLFCWWTKHKIWGANFKTAAGGTLQTKTPPT